MPEELDDPKYVMGGDYRPGFSEVAREVFAALSATTVAEYPVSIDDVSYWNGKVDFSVMRTVAQCVYIRAGYGNDGVDPKAQENAAGAKLAGMPWGLYWYVKVGKDFQKHVSSFKTVWEAYGGQLLPVFDIEYSETTSRQNNSNWLTKLVRNWVLQTNVNPMIYTRASWWNQYTARMDWPKACDLWVAQYTGAAQPIIPNDWGAVNNPRTWTLWQWSANGNRLGKEHGVDSADIDRNRYNGTIDAFNAKYGTSIAALGEVSPPQPPIEPPTEGEIQPIRRVKVLPSALNVRSGPGANYKDLGELVSNTVVPVVEVNGDWVKISGWVNKKYTKEVG